MQPKIPFHLFDLFLPPKYPKHRHKCFPLSIYVRMQNSVGYKKNGMEGFFMKDEGKFAAPEGRKMF